MKNYVKKGDSINYTVPAGGVTSGQLVLMNDIVGVAASTGVEDDVVPVAVCAVYSVNKAAEAMAVGEKLYFDEDNDQLTVSSEGGSPWGDLVLAGYCSAAALLADDEVEVKLIG